MTESYWADSKKTTVPAHCFFIAVRGGAMCESSNEAWVSDPVTATHHSLFQIGEKWMPFLGLTDVNDLFNPLVNACGALKIYEKEGWGPWLDSIDCHGYQ